MKSIIAFIFFLLALNAEFAFGQKQVGGKVGEIKEKGEWNKYNEEGLYYYNKGDYLNAKKEFESAIKNFSKKQIGTNEYYNVKWNLSLVYTYLGKYEVAEPILFEVLEYRRKKYGEINIEYAKSLEALADLYCQKLQFIKSEEIATKVLETINNIKGENNSDYARVLGLLGLINSETGNLEESESYLKKAIEISYAVLDSSNMTISSYLSNLGLVYMHKKEYSLAINNFNKALNLLKDSIGEMNPFYATILSNLSIAYSNTGNYKMAELLILKSIEISNQILGEVNALNGVKYNTLGLLYNELEQLEKANESFKKAQESSLLTGNKTQYHIIILNNLALSEENLEHYSIAEKIYFEALKFQKEMFGTENEEYCLLLGNLAQLYSELEKYELALPLFLEVEKIRKSISGKNDPITSNNIGRIYSELGEYDKAEQKYKEAINELNHLFENNLQLASILSNYAALSLKKGDYIKSDSLLMEYKKIVFKNIDNCLSFLSENENIILLNSFKSNFNFLRSYYLNFNNKIPSLKKDAYDLELKTKGGLMHSRIEIKKALLGNKRDSTSITLFNEWISCRNDLAKNYSMPEKDKKNTVILEKQAEDIEKKMARISINYNDINEETNFSTNQLFSVLNNNSIAIEFSSFSYWNKSWTDSALYVALILREDSAFPKIIQLFEIDEMIDFYDWEKHTDKDFLNLFYSNEIIEIPKNLPLGRVGIIFSKEPLPSGYLQIDSAIINLPAYKAGLLKGEQIVGVNGNDVNGFSLDSLRSRIIGPAGTSVKFIVQNNSGEKREVELMREFIEGYSPPKPKTNLYELIWQPLEPYLQGVDKIYYSPSGLLHTLNLQAIMAPDGKRMGEKYSMEQMSTTRNVVTTSGEPDKSSITLFGGINYDFVPAGKDSIEKETDFHQPDLSTTNRGATEYWYPLDGALDEVKLIKKQFDENKKSTTLITGEQASEETFKALSGHSPKILHISTHGFFFPDVERKKEDRKMLQLNEEKQVFKIADNPLLRSGLIMAHGNYTWQHQSNPYENEDGILTAYEISNMDLTNTDLVVLSACETGLGEIKGSEGVFGLQRAFKMAGVDYLMMSLWKVPDKETKEFMNDFYKNWLGGMKIREAFSATQKMMNQKYPNNPYLWAAFVLVE